RDHHRAPSARRRRPGAVRLRARPSRHQRRMPPALPRRDLLDVRAPPRLPLRPVTHAPVTEQLDPFARPDHGALFVVSGPSGAGKTTLVHRLLAHFPDMKFSVSATTRSPRPGEVAGKDYHFLTPQEFETKIAARAFLEHANVYGN